MKSVFFSFFILAIAFTPLAAQTVVARDEIVVTASALPETAGSTPAAVSVITRQDIDDHAARDVADVLREVPGLSVSRTGSPGRATSLFTRGGNSTHTLVLWNGIEINNPFFAGYDWGRFSTAGVEQIEVVRGPYSALYGSDAVAGVINVLTAPKRSGVRAEGEAGGNGLRNGNAGGAWVNGSLSASGAIESRRDDGFAPNDDFDQKSGEMALHWLGGDHVTAGLSGRYTSYDLGVPVNLNAAGDALVPSLQRRQSGSERQVAVPFTQTSKNLSYDVTLAESRRSDDFADPEDPFGSVWSKTESTSRRIRATARAATLLGTIVGGGEVERSVVDDRGNYGINLKSERRTDRSLFLEDRFSANFRGTSFELSAGARHDDFGDFGSQTSPRVALAWIAGMVKWRVAFGQAFRAPAIGELYYPFSGNLRLQPERSRSFEAGADWYGGAGELSVTAFRGHFRDLIVFDNVTYRFANVGLADSRGIEVAATHRPAGNIALAASYTFVDTDQDRSGQPLLRRPRHSGSLSAMWQNGPLHAGVVLLYNGSRADILPVAPFSRVTDRAYATADLTVQYRTTHYTPFVKIENAANATYEEVRGYPSPTRRAIAGIRFTD